MKVYYGGYEITKAMGYPPIDYAKITNFLNLIDVPMGKKKGIPIYRLTEKKVKMVKKTLEDLKIRLGGKE